MMNVESSVFTRRSTEIEFRSSAPHLQMNERTAMDAFGVVAFTGLGLLGLGNLQTGLAQTVEQRL